MQSPTLSAYDGSSPGSSSTSRARTWVAMAQGSLLVQASVTSRRRQESLYVASESEERRDAPLTGEASELSVLQSLSTTC